MTTEFSRPELIAAVAAHVPSTADDIEFAPIPTGKFNASYFVRVGNAEYVLRIAPPDDSVFVFYEQRMMHQEPEIHQLLIAETTVPVPRVVAFDEGRVVIDRDFVLMERLPGRPLTEAGAVDHQSVLRQIGESLAETHRVTAGAYGYLGAHRPMAPQSTWGEAFAVMWGLLIDDIVGVGFYDDCESQMMRQLLHRHASLFDREVPASLLHMDVWHQNILVDDRSRVTGLLDWDRALWGDPEIEFAVLDYCGISEPAFWDGYGHHRDVSAEASLRQAFYLLYEVQKYIVIEAGRRHNPEKADRYKRQVLNLVEARLGT